MPSGYLLVNGVPLLINGVPIYVQDTDDVAVPAAFASGIASGPDATIPRSEFLRRFGPAASTPATRATRTAQRRRSETLLLMS